MYSGELKSAFAEVKKLDGSLARHTGEEEESIAINQLSFISKRFLLAGKPFSVTVIHWLSFCCQDQSSSLKDSCL